MSAFARSPKKGAETSVYLASSKEVKGVSGCYFADKKEVESSKESYDETLRQDAWTKTEEVLGTDSWSYLRSIDGVMCDG